MFDLSYWPLSALLASFVLAAAVILYTGVKLAHTAEVIAYESGLGQAVVGAVFLGMSTSLSGAILSFYAAGNSFPSLAISNAIGGIAAQTAFLVVADITYKKGNLEHAANSLDNLLLAVLLVVLLAISLAAASTPEWTLVAIHPASFLMIAVYLYGLRLVRRSSEEPYWKATLTEESQRERDKSTGGDDSSSNRPLSHYIAGFILMAIVLGLSGIGLAETALEFSLRTGLSETAVGSLLTSVITSLPELITVLAAVQRGALNLAVGDIIGGNSFDVLFLAGSDLFYREGSLYHRFTSEHYFLISMVMIMSGVLLLGLIRRQRKGPANIGFESVTVLILYSFVVFYILFFAN